MRDIYLLRHCETEAPQKKRCIGITDTMLSENGLRHARRLGEYFAYKKLNGIFCSDAVRAVRTAEIISGGKIPVTRMAELREINLGGWDGMYFDDIRAKFPEEYRQRGLALATFAPPNGESFADCQKRAFKALRAVLERSSGDIAIIAHAGFNRTLICGLCHIDLQKIFAVPQPFGCANILSVQDGVCRVRKVGFPLDESE